MLVVAEDFVPMVEFQTGLTFGLLSSRSAMIGLARILSRRWMR